ncbi:cytochrome b [Salinarimonas rosea]|uniref:cytochrome b n=1 Tax=Salinarimonas rosea TaxID=552063 RepID=UPI000407FE21|nr:cytochrome b/b6 domain-containing protein [Salinarimonas rosea]
MARPTGYTRTQIVLHWAVVGLIALQYLLHEPIAEAWDAWRGGAEIAFDPLVAQHVVGGLLVAALAAWRLVLRFRHGAPPPPEAEHAALRAASHAAHWSFYAFMLLMPLSGAVAWFAGAQEAAEAHNVMKIALLALTGLHVAAVIFHQVVLKSGVLSRMRRPA